METWAEADRKQHGENACFELGVTARTRSVQDQADEACFGYRFTRDDQLGYAKKINTGLISTVQKH